jgi:hypothetical protein
MLGSLSRSLLLTATLGLLGACDLVEGPKEEAPTVEAVPAKKPVAAPAPAPVKKKAPVIKFDDGGSGGGGWG